MTLRRSMPKTTGSQIALSRGLGVTAFATLPSTKYPTTTQDQVGANACTFWKARPARAVMITANASRRASETPAKIRARSGRGPRHRPPRVSSPHGAPKMSAT